MAPRFERGAHLIVPSSWHRRRATSDERRHASAPGRSPCRRSVASRTSAFVLEPSSAVRGGDSLRARIVLMLVPVTLLLGTIELAFRFLPQPPPDAFLERLWSRSRPPSGGSPGRDGPLATNELGLRIRPTGRRRISRCWCWVTCSSWATAGEVTRTFPYPERP
jgi:hypothetical protein